MKDYKFCCMPKEQPVAWVVFYEDDGEFCKFTFSSEEAEKHSKMAYNVYPLYKEDM